MDLIKKTICLEAARTRTQGLMPYYALSGGGFSLVSASGENGNWGQFVANPVFLSEKDKTYQTMLDRYYGLLNMVRSSVKLRRVVPKNGETIFVKDTDSFYLNGECFFDGTEPDFLYEYAAYNSEDFYSTEINGLDGATESVYKTYEDGVVDADDPFIVLINKYDTFVGLSAYLDGTNYSVLESGVEIGENEHHKWSEYCRVVDSCIGKLSVPAYIYNKHIKAPKSIAYADIESYIKWLSDNSGNTLDCCSARLWDDMGGADMLKYLNESFVEYTERLNLLNGLDYTVPYVDVPLLIIQELTDIGVLTNLDGVSYESDAAEGDPKKVTDSEYVRPHGIFSGNPDTLLTEDEIDEIVFSGKGLTIDQIVMGQERKNDLSIRVESLLKTLQSNKKYTDDNDNVLPGLFAQFSGSPAGKFYKCEKSGDEWVMNEVSGGNLKNGDGKSSEEVKNTVFYRTITTVSAGKRISEVYDNESSNDPDEQAPAEFFYYKVKYDNSSTVPMTLTYVEGNTANLRRIDGDLYHGDMLLEVNPDETEKTIEVRYAIGADIVKNNDGTFSYSGGGDIYYEKHPFDEKRLMYVSIDGVDEVPIWSEYVDFEADAEQFYSPRYNLYRTGNTATITEMTTGEVWNEDNAFDAYLTKEEYLLNFSNPPKVDVNVTIDRGGVSAFESHYKLSECNTMADLENYGNGSFFGMNE